MEKLHGVDTILLDKTGTITQGRPSVIQVVPAAGFSEETVLASAAAPTFFDEIMIDIEFDEKRRPTQTGYFVDGAVGANNNPSLQLFMLALEPSYKSPEAILAIMASTPAVLHRFTSSLSAAQWSHEPTRDDWAMNEIICHLRDTEREIHQLQLNLMLEREDAFIPRPDTSVWASEREYLTVDGPSALQEFAAARLENIDKLKQLDASVWSRRARHAIFGPTNFLEVTGFLTDHDQMHVQQAWKTLRQL